MWRNGCIRVNIGDQREEKVFFIFFGGEGECFSDGHIRTVTALKVKVSEIVFKENF
jgi:hypothetical protein